MRITVIGQPITQGSKSGFPFRRKDGSLGVAMTEGGKSASLKEWRGAIAAEARRWIAENGQGAPLDGPLALDVAFYLPRPKSAAKSVTRPFTRPDCTKLVRAVEDALSKIAYVDDSRIVRLVVEKRFAVNKPPSVDISLMPIEEYDNPLRGLCELTASGAFLPPVKI